jgi:ribosome-associated heat shock protein Hsp15
MEKEKLRLDKYLWAIRLFKTRTQASTAIEQGKVKYNGEPVKASRQVGMGDKYDIKTEGRRWVIEVTGLLHTRVQYSEAVTFYLDLTPKEELENSRGKSVFVDYTGKRQSKSGRPTKKKRRDLDGIWDGE